jgi:hypothetical protein
MIETDHDRHDRRPCIEGYAMMHGLTLAQVMIEEGVSCSIPVEQRPIGGPLFAKLQRGDIVVAAKLDRARSNPRTHRASEGGSKVAWPLSRGESPFRIPARRDWRADPYEPEQEAIAVMVALRAERKPLRAIAAVMVAKATWSPTKEWRAS